MQTGSAIVLTSLLSCAATAVAVTYLHRWEVQARDQVEHGNAEALPGTIEIEERLTRIERRLEGLATTPAEANGPARRQSALQRSDIEAIVRGMLRERDAEASAGDAEAATLDFDLERELDQLLGPGLDYDARGRILKRAKKAGQLDEVISRLKRRAEENPAIAQAQLELGQAYLEKLMGMPPGPETGFLALAADKAFDRALEVEPEHWEARYVKAISLSFWPPMFGKKAEAIAQFETLRAQQERQTPRPEHAQTYQLLGNLYSEQGKDEEARKIWQEGLERFPQNEELRRRSSGH